MNTERIIIESYPEGQITISVVDEHGSGHGYRICGPKMAGCDSAPIASHELSERDKAAIAMYLRPLDTPEPE